MPEWTDIWAEAAAAEHPAGSTPPPAPPASAPQRPTPPAKKQTRNKTSRATATETADFQAALEQEPLPSTQTAPQPQQTTPASTPAGELVMTPRQLAAHRKRQQEARALNDQLTRDTWAILGSQRTARVHLLRTGREVLVPGTWFEFDIDVIRTNRATLQEAQAQLDAGHWIILRYDGSRAGHSRGAWARLMVTGDTHRMNPDEVEALRGLTHPALGT